MKLDKCVLQYTDQLIVSDNHYTYKRLYLQECYLEVNKYKKINYIEKCIISILNSMIYQERLFFALNYKTTKFLLKNDKNWKTKTKLSVNNYLDVLNTMVNWGLIEIIAGNVSEYVACEVVDKDLLRMLTPYTEEEQKDQLENMYARSPKHSDKPWVNKRRKVFMEATKNLNKQEKQAMKDIYTACKNISKKTGIPHHVDHVIAIANGGLHHPNNLQILTAFDNLKKGKK